MTHPVLCHCLVLVLLRPKTIQQISSQRHTALCCQTHNMQGLILAKTFSNGAETQILKCAMNLQQEGTSG